VFEFQGAGSWARRVLGIAGLVLLVSGCGVGSSADPVVTSSETSLEEVPDDRLDGPPLSDAFVESWCSEARAALEAMNRWDIGKISITTPDDDSLMCSFSLREPDSVEDVGWAFLEVGAMTEKDMAWLERKNSKAGAPVDACEAASNFGFKEEFRLATTAGVEHCRTYYEEHIGHTAIARFKQSQSSISASMSIIPGRSVPLAEIDPLCDELVDAFLVAYTATALQ